MDRYHILLDLSRKLPQLSEKRLFYLSSFIDECLLDKPDSISEKSTEVTFEHTDIEIKDSPAYYTTHK